MGIAVLRCGDCAVGRAVWLWSLSLSRGGRGYCRRWWGMVGSYEGRTTPMKVAIQGEGEPRAS
jgi:hypothetical protein